MLTREPKRILILAPFPPGLAAAHGGARVLANAVMRLSERHRVGLLYLRGASDPPADTEVAAACQVVIEVPRPELNLSKRKLLASLLSGTPKWAALWNVPEFARSVRTLYAAWNPDVVQAEFHVMGQYLSILPAGVPKVLVQHEIGSVAAAERVASSGLLARLPLRLNLHAWRRFERRVARAADSVVVFTERDRQALAALGTAAATRCIPFGPTLKLSSPAPSGEQEILFIGNFAHPPNVDAALRLIRQIYPAVLTRWPDATLRIVGEHPTAEMLRAAIPGVVIMGRVPDVQPLLAKAAIVAAPLRLGGGMRVKVLDAMAAGCPLVASPRAIEGMPLEDGRHFLLADSDCKFCDQIVRALGDPSLRQALSREASDWVRRNAGWEKWTEAYEDLYDSLRGASVVARA